MKSKAHSPAKQPQAYLLYQQWPRGCRGCCGNGGVTNLMTELQKARHYSLPEDAEAKREEGRACLPINIFPENCGQETARTVPQDGARHQHARFEMYSQGTMRCSHGHRCRIVGRGRFCDHSNLNLVHGWSVYHNWCRRHSHKGLTDLVCSLKEADISSALVICVSTPQGAKETARGKKDEDDAKHRPLVSGWAAGLVRVMAAVRTCTRAES